MFSAKSIMSVRTKRMALMSFGLQYCVASERVDEAEDAW